MSDTEALARALGLPVEGCEARHETLLAQCRALEGARDTRGEAASGHDDFDALSLATTYRDAAVVALAYDAEAARADLAQAAEWYRRLAQPVAGWYRSVSPPIADWLDSAASTGASDRLSAAHRAATVIDRLLASGPPAFGGPPRRTGRSGADPFLWGPAEAPIGGPSEVARRNPAQDAYALLTGGLLAARHPRLPDLLKQTASTGQPRSAAPVGALGMPLRWFWKASMALAFDDGPERLLGLLLAPARLQDAALREARRDARGYRRLTAPVDVIDLDIALLASAAALRWGLDESAWEQVAGGRIAAPDDEPGHAATSPPPGHGRGLRGPDEAEGLAEVGEDGPVVWDDLPELGAVSVRAGLVLGAGSSSDGHSGPA